MQRSNQFIQTASILVALSITTTLVGVNAVADEKMPPASTKPLLPSSRYNGDVPIDMNNGVLFNNGTFGLPNKAIQEWAEQPELPGLSDLFYPFERKDDFIAGVNEQVKFVDTAIWNWSRTSNRWPEVTAYAKDATEKMTPLLERLKKAVGEAQSANAVQWKSAEEEARRALVDMRLNYTQLHHNVVNR